MSNKMKSVAIHNYQPDDEHERLYCKLKHIYTEFIKNTTKIPDTFAPCWIHILNQINSFSTLRELCHCTPIETPCELDATKDDIRRQLSVRTIDDFIHYYGILKHYRYGFDLCDHINGAIHLYNNSKPHAQLKPLITYAQYCRILEYYQTFGKYIVRITDPSQLTDLCRQLDIKWSEDVNICKTRLLEQANIYDFEYL